MSDWWRWEERDGPFPARRLVVDPKIRKQLYRFMEYEFCPWNRGNVKIHQAGNFVHAVDGVNGQALCITVGDLTSLERRRGTEVITCAQDIPSGEWQVLGAWGYV